MSFSPRLATRCCAKIATSIRTMIHENVEVKKMNPADYSALDEALEIMASNGPELNNGFSNHAPMAIEAMCAMGRRDSVMPWFERYRRWLAPRRARVARLTDDNWRGALGDAR